MVLQQLVCAGEKGMSAQGPSGVSHCVLLPELGNATCWPGAAETSSVDRSSFGDGLKKEDNMREKKDGEERRLSRPASC
jgi:hypothetical protein